MVDWSNSIWFKYSVPKFAFQSWLAIRNRLSTKDRMVNWSYGLSPAPSTRCVLCNNALETRNHLFFSCDFASKIWSAMAKGLLGNNYTTNWTCLLHQLTSTSLNWELLFLLRLVFQTSIYHIWRERNNRQHGERPTTATRLIVLIDKTIRNWISTILSTEDTNFNNTMITWFASRSLP